MCFYIDGNQPNPKVADRDIPCYKIVSQDNLSRVRDEPYKIGLMRAKKVIKILDIKFKFPVLKIKKDNKWEGEINYGLHSYTSKARAFKSIGELGEYNFKHKVIECLIPKGTRYYENTSEFVSPKLRINSLEALTRDED